MGDQFDSLINVTISYPDNPETLQDFLMGRMKRIRVRIELPVDEQLVGITSTTSSSSAASRSG